MVPVETSVKFTAKGAVPAVGLPEKLATSGILPVPITVLVELPALAVTKTMLLLKAPSLPGANWTWTLVELSAGRLKGLPDSTLKGPLPTLTVTLLAATSPRLVTSRLAPALAAGATTPKSRPRGGNI